MAATVSSVTAPRPIGDQFKVEASVSFDDSYPTGGEQITAVSCGLAYFEDGQVINSKGYASDFVVATGGGTAKLKMYYSDYSTGDIAFTEVASGADLSAIQVRIQVFGK